ncbi:C-type lectin 37Da-like [Sabethes cyaneus]|uniref:C-type lectin 37Da-like n=1 Tax=Sabethes cyaneus TaxID=53552 RepID=UPI00237ED62C|nr:C-type lectin 37Da-like [Sabethes cyaneus]
MTKKFITLLIFVQFTLGAKRYFIPNLKANWHKANEFCVTLGMNLASVKSLVEHTELIRFVEKTDKFSNATRFWIGASDLAEEGVYTWVSNGHLVTFTNWADNEPNNVNDTEHCIEIIHNTYVNRVWQWNDRECRSAIEYFICETADKQCIEQF